MAGSTSDINTRFDTGDWRRKMHIGGVSICTGHSQKRMRITSISTFPIKTKRAKTTLMSQRVATSTCRCATRARSLRP